MSVKCNDRHGRWRSRTVAFRASDEEVSRNILIELRRINDDHELPVELREVMQVLASTLQGLGGVESSTETAVAEASMTNLQRGG